MTSLFTFRFRLFNTLADFQRGNKAREINASELFSEKNLLILGDNVNGENGLLYQLYQVSRKGTSESFMFPGFNFDQISRWLQTSKRGMPTYVFIDKFFENPATLIQQETSKLYELAKIYPHAIFYTAITYEGLKRNPFLQFSSDFKVAEHIATPGINEQASPVEEEIRRQKSQPVEETKQQKSEPTEEIKQQKSEPAIPKSRPNRRSSKKQFEPTTTLYDDVFKEIINGSEFSLIQESENFLNETGLNNHRNYKDLILNAQTVPERLEAAKKLGDQLQNSTSGIDDIEKQSADRYGITKGIFSCVRDISSAYRFHETRINNNLSFQRNVEQEKQWALCFLKQFVPFGLVSFNDPTIENYDAYFSSPDSQPYIFEESVKKRIVENIFEVPYERNRFVPLVWGYFESLGRINIKNYQNLGFYISSVLLHPKIRAAWNKSEPPPPPDTFNNGRVIGQYSPDEASEVDHLNFKHDVHALAALIAYEKTPLPLAIGLFGNWGSGKSSFMRQLQKRVHTLSTEQYDNKEVVAASNGEMPYCSKIAHITFNAWHFSDANLWASMMVHIFDELLKAIVVEKDRADLRKDLLNNLSTAREALREAEKELQESKLRVKEAEQALAKEQLTQQDIDAELKKIEYSLGDVVSALMKDEQFKSAVNHTAKEIGYDKLIQGKDDLASLKAEITDEGKRWKRAIGNLFRGNIQYSWFFLLLLAAPVFAIVLYKLDVTGIKTNITSIGVAVAGVLGWVRLQLTKFTGFRNKLEDIQQREENKVRAKLEQREKELKEKLAFYATSVQQKEKQVEIAKQNETDAQKALDDIDINRQLTSFIKERQSGNNYQQHLGIISLIRKDFEALSKYLKTGRNEKKNKDRIIDRIVLYIDDLDRCKTERVVAVLEAVHLLLALDLFVVVVGVDPRWVSKALKEQYKEQLHLDASEDSDTSRLPGQRATPFDYLEKIFQVPFVLRSMDNSGAKKLLDNLFKDQVKKKEEPETKKEEQTNFDQRREQLLQSNRGNFIKNLELERLENEKKVAEETEETQKKKAEEEEAKKKEFIEQVENLTISEEELEFMKNIAPIIGSTPRTVKRYGNLYRLLRVHSDLPNYSSTNLPIYQSVMLLLSISVSNGSIARPFFAALRESKKTGFYEMNADLIAAIKKDALEANELAEKDEEVKEKADALNEQLQALNQLHTELGKLPAEIKNFSVAILRKYSPVVSRFSFRTLNCVEEEIAQ